MKMSLITRASTLGFAASFGSIVVSGFNFLDHPTNLETAAFFLVVGIYGFFLSYICYIVEEALINE